MTYNPLAHVLATVIDLVLVAEWRVLSDVDSFALNKLAELRLLKLRVKFHLDRSRHDRRFLQKSLKLGV